MENKTAHLHKRGTPAAQAFRPEGLSCIRTYLGSVWEILTPEGVSYRAKTEDREEETEERHGSKDLPAHERQEPRCKPDER